jgi:anionic cell wall polymer biosynthesis LytR-Cps2A-Psr (LCP) family protein
LISKTEAEGRVNILLLGVGDAGHAGSTLADTMIVASVDPETKDVAMLSLPRDLYVPIPKNGKNKINAAHAFGEMQKRVRDQISRKKWLRGARYSGAQLRAG